MGMPRTGQQGGRAGLTADGGFSLVEVVVAMLLLMVISLAVAPLLITVTASSVQNRDQAAATVVANARIAELRAAFPDSSTTTSCGSVLASTGGIDASTGLSAALSFPDGCPAQYPGTVRVDVVVSDDAQPLATVRTEILVSRA